MSVKIRKCDRCGAEIKKLDWDGKVDYALVYRRYLLDGVDNAHHLTFDLCLNCRDQLHKWMEVNENV